jgi:hypothetical protein
MSLTFNRIQITVILVLLAALQAQAQQPALMGLGVTETSFNASSATTLTTGTAFSVPSNGTIFSWQVSYSSPPQTSVTIVTQGSYDNSNWFTIDTSTAVNGELRSFTAAIKFVRCTLSARTGSGTFTCLITVKSGNLITSATAPMLFGDGTASAPSISFTSDTSTGFRHSGSTATGAMLFDSIGSDVFVVGGVGVGLTLNAVSLLQWGSAGVNSPDTAIGRNAAGKIVLTGTTPMLQLGGTTSSFPAIKNSTGNLFVRLADDSAMAPIYASIFGIANPLLTNGSPSISSGFGTSPAILSQNGTSTFRVNVGTGGVATSGVIALSLAAATGWNCQVTDMTTNIVTRQTASTTTTVTITAASAWTASDTLIFNCMAY